MKYADTNALIHLITRQQPPAVDALEAVLADASAEVMIIEGVLVETCTLLEFNPRFGLPRRLICAGLEAVFSRQPVTVSVTALAAFQLYKSHPKLDIVDCLLAVYADFRADDVLTFDKGLQKILR